ncbi:adenylosuccinate synthetase [Nocardiopsis ansamitocini]|uniref:Adenylosuccinate synthetase n=1 Tax=Nocardiopsis ansamitocini TaxID=1670832 RepID=A0A9W6UJ71_9ACTN|nr:adenylosuccinate synthetase [Nocardiopsis ansamitocini]GLU48198.1 adenylosuccinate synthetase [Nocardiopsis ansamitocini]
MQSPVIVVDLGFGDAGKGTVVDWLCARDGGRPASVVRFNGGAQAAHNVVTPDGRHHTFAQLGAGMFTPGTVTLLSRFMLVDPLALAAEAAHLQQLGVVAPLSRVMVDADALVTTPYHRAANQARERARGAGRHGSCGMGVGETARYGVCHGEQAPRVGDCADPVRMRRLLGVLRERLEAELGPLGGPSVQECAQVFAAFAQRVEVVGGGRLKELVARGPVVMEGAQGVLLDEWHGLHPYTTWSTTTSANARVLLEEAGADAPYTLGVVRTYTPRHGPGPLPTEDPGLGRALVEAHNGTGPWQGAFRVGHFDGPLHRYAVAATGGVDGVALTHVDAPERAGLRLCTGYDTEWGPMEEVPAAVVGDLERQQELGRVLDKAVPRLVEVGAREWPGVVEQALGAPVVVASRGPGRGDKQVRAAGRAVV